ncbi:MAG: UbiD family decarboxylase [Chloroflexi bacterium]|nr:UbiD family decarboxylase [Chloroflexota bacterium]
MGFRDNRDFIAALQHTGDAKVIKKEVDWDLEAGAITRRVCETGGPAPLFEKVRDYPPGYRIFGAPLASYRRLAVAMDLKPDSSVQAIQEEYERRIEHPVKPKVVKDGPCKENVVKGKDVDLLQFPVPMVHDGDGGRYIGTWHLTINKDPDSDWTNWGMYRLMVHNRNQMAGFFAPHQHQGLIYFRKYQPKNRPMPFAVAIGADPLSSLTAGTAFKKGENEADFAGALARQPIEVVKCETNDLLAPAYSEIVLEGEVIPGTNIPEGPFGEYPGYRFPERRSSPIFQVNAVTYRNDPIMTLSCVGFPVDDSHVSVSIGAAVAFKRSLKQRGVPVTQVNWPAEGVEHLMVVGIEKRDDATIDLIEQMVLGSRTPICVTAIVDADVDVFNLKEVLHAFLTKCHPLKGVRRHESFWTLSPYLSHEEWLNNKGGRLILDCTWPSSWKKETTIPPRASFADMYPQEIKDLVLKNWKEYGF